MAIVLVNTIRENELRMAYNNDILRFYSDDTDADPTHATITGPGLSITLYPGPDGMFFFNFKPYVTALINTRNFEDTLETDLLTTDPQTFIYDYTDGTYLSKGINVKIFLDDDTFDVAGYSLAWIAGAQQIGENNPLSKPSFYMLSPFSIEGNDRWYLKYWQGYPFDVPFYIEPDAAIRLNNLTTGLSEEFIQEDGYVKRLFFSDGRTDECIEDILPIAEGINQMVITSDLIEGSKYLMLEKAPYACGVYFKWLNKFGGYSYWLFENTAAIDRAGKSLGELYNDYNNLFDTHGRTLNIGQQTQDTIKVVAELLTKEQMKIVEGIIDSPKIYLFTGQPFAQNDYHNWTEVTLKTGSVRVKNFKEALNNIALDFELPERYTQTLI